MNLKSLYLFVISFLTYTSCELLGVIQLNRHGARTGENFDELTKSVFYGSSNSQLTINGLKQHELHGQWVAERYITHDYKLLSKEYKPEEALFVSTPYERTIFSVAGFIKGLYPYSKVKFSFKGDEKMKTDDIPPICFFRLRNNFPEVPVSVQDPNNDPLFKTNKCKLNNETVKSMLKIKKIYNFTKEEIQNAIDEIKSKWPEPFINKTDKEIYSEKFLKHLNTFIRPTEYHFNNNFFNLTKNTHLVLNKIQIGKWYDDKIEDSEGLKLLVSPLFGEFLNYFGNFVQKQGLKYVHFSAHDSSIITLISNLFKQNKLEEMMNNLDENFDFLQPPFASHLIFELHSLDSLEIMGENQKEYIIRIVYNGKVITDGLREEIEYDNNVKGIFLSNFIKYLKTRIDMRYLFLKCERGDDD